MAAIWVTHDARSSATRVEHASIRLRKEKHGNVKKLEREGKRERLSVAVAAQPTVLINIKKNSQK